MKAQKLIRAMTAAAAVLAIAPSASAQAVSGDVTVQVNLTSQCRLKSGGSPIVDFGTYIAFGGAATGSSDSVVFECTRGYGATPTAAWDTLGGTAAGVGVIEGLQYTLSVSAGSRVGGTDASVSTTGTPDTVTYNIGGTMPGGQAGAGNGGAAVTATRTLMVTF